MHPAKRGWGRPTALSQAGRDPQFLGLPPSLIPKGQRRTQLSRHKRTFISAVGGGGHVFSKGWLRDTRTRSDSLAAQEGHAEKLPAVPLEGATHLLRSAG